MEENDTYIIVFYMPLVPKNTININNQRYIVDETKTFYAWAEFRFLSGIKRLFYFFGGYNMCGFVGAFDLASGSKPVEEGLKEMQAQCEEVQAQYK